MAVSNEDDSKLAVELPEYSVKDELLETVEPVRALLITDDDPFRPYRGKSVLDQVLGFLFYIFPILDWGSKYKLKDLPGDIIGGLTIASLAVPQDLGYANLAYVPPVNGLYSSFVPPLTYAVLGTSRHIAIGPTAVLSLLIGTLCKDQIDPIKEPKLYLQFVWTATFFCGIIQLGMGLLRLGFVVDFLSHAAVVGFMGGAAITIGLQQLKGLLGYTKFTNTTNIVAVLSYIFDHTNQFNWRAFLIGISILTFLLSLKVAAWYFKKVKVVGKVLFFANALGPFLSVVIVTLCVWATKANKAPANVPCVKKMPSGFKHLSSIDHLLLSSEWTGKAAGVGTVVALIGLAEAIAIARTFAALKGYHIDGNREFIAYGAMNLFASFTSSIATTGSFSRSSVNYQSGGNTMLTNIIMSVVIVITLACLTSVFQYLPQAVLSAIIISAVITLIDLPSMWRIFKTDKVDFLVVMGTFFGVVFDSVEIGLLIGVAISMVKVLVLVTRPHLAVLGEIPGTTVYRNVKQYPYAKQAEGILVVRVDAPVYFTNANYIREKVLLLATNYEADNLVRLTHVILEFTPVPDIDTTGIHSLEELHGLLQGMNVELGISNPSHMVLRKLQAARFLDEIGGDKLFLSVNEAMKTCKVLRESSVKDPHWTE